MLLPDELKSNLNDILDYEHFYLLSFYYRMNKEKCSVEFIHKSLMEYLVGEMLYYNLLPILNSKLNEEKNIFFAICFATSLQFLYNNSGSVSVFPPS